MQKYSAVVQDVQIQARNVPDINGAYYLASEVDARIAELEKRLAHFEAGEYICAKCGLRQETPKQDAPF